MADEFDLIVLGAGTGGYAAAIRYSSLGKRVALIERDKIGGTCVNRGCIPTKALLHSAEVFDTIKEAKGFGITASEPTYEWPDVQEYKDRVVGKSQKGLEGLIKQHGIEIVTGSGTMEGPTAVRVGDRRLTAKNVVVATGSEPKMIPGLTRGGRVITSDEALIEGVPKSAIVLGAGSVGIEFASIWASFGAKVTVVEMLPGLLPLEDAELGRELGRAFTKRGITSLTGAKLEDASVTDDGVRATVTTDGKTDTIDAEVLLVAVGRGVVTEGAGLDAAGVHLDQRGFVQIDEKLQTTQPGVFAIGDCINTPGLAHVAFGEGIFVAEHLAGMDPTPIDYNAVPRATYSAPEVAAVGMTEAQAREQGLDVVTRKVNLAAIAKANILGTSGFCKVVAEKGGRVLGVHYIGARVTELVAEAMLAVGWEAMPEEIARLIHPHPTLSESFGEASLALSGRALHVL
ncbi:MAG: dihydrolipoyl dehydrogenase [Actinomycetota bacterium]